MIKIYNQILKIKILPQIRKNNNDNKIWIMKFNKNKCWKLIGD